MRLPSGTPVSPAMKTPPKTQADEGDAEKRLPRASATLTFVVSGDPCPDRGAADAVSWAWGLGRRSGARAPGSNRQGLPGRGRLYAASDAMSRRRSAA